MAMAAMELMALLEVRNVASVAGTASSCVNDALGDELVGCAGSGPFPEAFEGGRIRVAERLNIDGRLLSEIVDFFCPTPLECSSFFLPARRISISRISFRSFFTALKRRAHAKRIRKMMQPQMAGTVLHERPVNAHSNASMDRLFIDTADRVYASKSSADEGNSKTMNSVR